MSFLQPILLFALPLAALPVIIHLVHLHRRRPVPWAAMMFLQAARRMSRGYSRLRRWLILAFRVLAAAALLLMASRPLAGGWLGWAGGAPDIALVLLDRSASMEQQHPATGLSKRETGLAKLAEGIREAYRGRTRVTLIDSATLSPEEVPRPEALLDLPATWPTETAADIPALLQAAMDHLAASQSGRADLWLLSDLQQSDWDPGGGRWEALRQAFAGMPGIRFHLLCYPESPAGNLAVTAGRAERRERAGRAELLLDLEISAPGEGVETPARELPLRVVIEGAASVLEVTPRDGRLSLQGHSIPLDGGQTRGWGRLELPADTLPGDNAWHFVFDEPASARAVIVSDDPAAMRGARVALEASPHPSRRMEASMLGSAEAAAIPWEETALIVWQAPLPAPGDLIARQLESHLAAGRGLLFLPPERDEGHSFLGIRWGDWKGSGEEGAARPVWWRADEDLLASTRDGAALPVGELDVARRREILPESGGSGDAPGVALALMEGREPLLLRALPGRGADLVPGAAYFLGALPGAGESSLARDGVVLYALLQRAVEAGAGGLGKTRQRFAGAGALEEPEEGEPWSRVDPAGDPAADSPAMLPLRAGVTRSGERLVALNRPPGEDAPERLPVSALDELFAGLDYRVVEDRLGSERSLASEIWRLLLFFMAAALALEALLSLPARQAASPAGSSAPSPKPA